MMPEKVCRRGVRYADIHIYTHFFWISICIYIYTSLESVKPWES